MTHRARGTRWLVVGLIALVLAAFWSMTIGVIPLTVSNLLSPTPEQRELILTSRLPRAVAVLLAGASLSIAGLIMQRITQNPFVSPSTSGTVEAAVLGILIVTLVAPGASLMVKMLVAIATSLVGTSVFLRLLRAMPIREPVVVALGGIMYGGVLSAVTVFVAYQRDLLQLLEIWTTGSFSAILQGHYEPLYLVVAVGSMGWYFAHRFTVAGMGRDVATSLGVAYAKVLRVGIVIVSVMAATVVVVVGVIPFLGLIVPNIVTLLLGDNVARALPVTALAGAGFVLACDVVGRLLRFPYEVPVSTVAGVIGAGVFLWLVLRSARGSAAGGG